MMTRDNNAHSGDEDFATGLRQSLATRAADVRMPPGLLDRAVTRNRKRAARNRLIGAAGTAAVVATATVTALSLGHQEARTASASSAPHPSATVPRVVDAAYVLQRAAGAQLNSYRMISVTQSRLAGIEYTDVSTQQTLDIFGPRDSAGQPYFELADDIKNGVDTTTTIDNQHHAYSITNSSVGRPGPNDAAYISNYLPLQDQSDPHTAFQVALKDGTITVVGHQNLRGQDTILLRIKPMKKTLITATEIWIDASTYQVVQVENWRLVFIYKKTGKPVRWGIDPIRSKSDIVGKVEPSPLILVSWLPPTPENLAKLTITPPSGYIHISEWKMGLYLEPFS